ncbi:serine/threonine-protein kinase [Streptomyces sp. NPDC005262]|uniref:serine/threonine-protein kinase n=1 Tax=Streptomyces sp. NPDC005262 TaxID=3364710 RepID=UPI00368D523A
MGIVYLARSRGGRTVAVKVARPELAVDPAFRERFRAEIAAARTVGGFHTASVVDADPDAEAPWLATAYVPGPTLSQLLASKGPMNEEELCRLGAALAEALLAIHGCGLIHRDLKPGNIIMAEDGPRVLDFGIARAVENTRLTATGTAFGTPGFLAPEQAEGRDVGGSADVFALGAVLVAAAGGSAFGGGTPVALMYRSVHQEADLSAVPDSLRPMVAACLEKEAGRRPTTEQLLDWLSARDADGDGIESGAAAKGTGHPPTVYVPPAFPVPPAYAPTVTAPAAVPAARGVGPTDDLEFLAMDHKNAVVADADGIAIGRNGRTAGFSWAEIKSADCAKERQGTVLKVTITLTDGSIHTCQVTTRLAELDEWITQLNTLLDHFLAPA